MCCLLIWGCSESQNSEGSASRPASVPPGEEVYNRFCFSCHAAGIAGAPKTRAPEAWGSRLAKGRAALLQATLQGLPPGMPPKGLCTQCSEGELSAAIDYMLPIQ